MTGAVFARDRVDAVLTEAKLPPSYRIIPRHHFETPLLSAPGDSRFCSKIDDYTILYAAPDFATAFIETIVRDRFTRKRRREVALKEITERAWALVLTKPRARLR